MNCEGFINKHRLKIRCMVDWDKVVDLQIPVKVQTLRAGKGKFIYHPWYWTDQDGKPIKNHQTGAPLVYGVDWGLRDSVLEIPGAKFERTLMALDGNRYLREARPKTIVVEYLDCQTPEQAACFADFVQLLPR